MSANSRNEKGLNPKQDWSKMVVKEKEEIDSTIDPGPENVKFCPYYINDYKCQFG